MKKIFLILLNSLFVSILHGQTLLQQIEQAYTKLDSVSYIAKIKLSHEEHLLKEALQDYKKFTEELGIDYDSTEFDYDYQMLQIEHFNTKIDYAIPQYVLNLVFKPSEEKSLATLQVDTTELCFNLFYLWNHQFCFCNNYQRNFYVYCNDGKYSFDHSPWKILFRKKNLRRIDPSKSFKIVMKKNPKYLLYCKSLDEFNIISEYKNFEVYGYRYRYIYKYIRESGVFLYVLNDKIYVHRIIERKDYELEEYFEKFIMPQN